MTWNHTLFLTGAPPWHWAVSGAALGLITLFLLFLANRRLGISTSFENVCALVSRRPYFQRSDVRGPGVWRLFFIVGSLACGFALAYLSRDGVTTLTALGVFDGVIGWGLAGKLGWMFAGGLSIGFGT